MSRQRNAFYLAALFGLLGSVTVAPSCQKAPLPPKETTGSPAEATPWMEFHPLGDARLFFRMRVPRGWQARPREISPMELQADLSHADWTASVVLGEVEPPPSDNQPHVFIRVGHWQIPPRDAAVMTLDQFIEFTLVRLVIGQNDPPDPEKARKKWAVLTRQTGRTKGNDYKEELVEIDSSAWGLTTLRVRVIRRSPEEAFVVVGLAPSPQYPRFEQTFSAAIESFSLLNP